MSNTQNTTKSPLLIILFTIFAMTGVMGGAGWWILHAEKENNSQSVQIENELEVMPPAPIFLPLSPFTINLISDDNKNRVIYIEITLRLADETTRQHLEQYMPEVRSRLLLLISRQNISELASDEGKLSLMSDIKEVLRPGLVVGGSEHTITDVLFTTFILR
ncbi:flagellar basal body-associated protein FliL [Moellerella wisconsensis]|uniref:Flagellar protein FliL n=2 Tax=Moellerella wisconsensis TaxID=158849 RepID=A0A0N0Z9J0_9GAMM|nr:flagellar basal body-associated protein FliL [Moellerella wisconsensis]KLN96294.1 hypothetical protein VK86_10670 [Moellerella wisconsensis]KPD02324.1 FliL family flagellar biosynthesis protein [Moellerella wisconsensis ATCC 35017]UNH25230.1 flagellar basal body-associated protein FliL [Moellerella wisconsensis]UNH28393.1 flagellar basal body-associated protein FliL [Moellerella wisconsensis]UNH39898.1 flagellar basal body-associated protein FliL [Moellerella wisconsensis]